MIDDAQARAVAAHVAGDLASAEAAYREAADGGDAASAFQLGRLLNDRGDREGAARAYEQAAKSGHVEASLNLAILCADHLRRPDDAVRLWRAAADRGDRRAMFDLALHCWDIDDRGAAKDALQQLGYAGEPRGYLVLGLMLAEENEPEAALNAFQRAASAGVADAWTEVGWVLEELERRDEAEAALRRGYDAGDLAAAAILQRVLRSQGKETEAQALAAAAAERARRHVRLEYRTLLSALDGEGLKEEELSGWITDEFPEPVPRELAALVFDSPRLAEAITRLKLAIEYGDEEAIVDLARLYEMLGRHAAADRLLRRAEADSA